jgi:tripartite ATP-independent transporter DctP family solute receptor
MHHKLHRRSVLTGLLLAGLGAFSATALSAETLKWAHVYETSHPNHKWAEWAAEEIDKRTEGRYEIDIFPASSLGKQADIDEGLTLGTVDIVYTGVQFAGRDHADVGLLGAPYVFRDLDHWKAVRDSELFGEIAQGYQDQTGHHIAALNYYGSRHTTSNKRIETPEDMQGLKIRVPNAPLYMMFPEAQGANATPIAFAEVYLALQQGVVDAEENPLPTIQSMKFHEVQDYVVMTGHITDSLVTIVSGNVWDGLSDEDKAIFDEVLAEAAEGVTADVEKSEQELIEYFKSEGLEIIDVDREPFRKNVLPLLQDGSQDWSPETFDKLQAVK